MCNQNYVKNKKIQTFFALKKIFKDQSGYDITGSQRMLERGEKRKTLASSKAPNRIKMVPVSPFVYPKEKALYNLVL